MIHSSHVHPPLTTRRLNTAKQVNNMGALHLMYNWHIYTSHNYYYPTSSLYFFYTPGQAGWPRPLMSGTFIMISDLKNNLKKGLQRRIPRKLFLKYSFRPVTSKYSRLFSVHNDLFEKKCFHSNKWFCFLVWKSEIHRTAENEKERIRFKKKNILWLIDIAQQFTPPPRPLPRTEVRRTLIYDCIINRFLNSFFFHTVHFIHGLSLYSNALFEGWNPWIWLCKQLL